jgi:hypothetical protein
MKVATDYTSGMALDRQVLPLQPRKQSIDGEAKHWDGSFFAKSEIKVLTCKEPKTMPKKTHNRLEQTQQNCSALLKTKLIPRGYLPNHSWSAVKLNRYKTHDQWEIHYALNPSENYMTFIGNCDPSAAPELTGEGIMTFVNNANTYRGEFKQSLPDGYGIFEFNHKQIFNGVIYPRGTTYQGNWLNGRPHGQGTFIFSPEQDFNGISYHSITSCSGIWKNGLPLGNISITSVKGFKRGFSFAINDFDKYDIHTNTYDSTQVQMLSYFGPLRNWLPHGYGKASYLNGEQYEGIFVNGQRHGQNLITGVFYQNDIANPDMEEADNLSIPSEINLPEDSRHDTLDDKLAVNPKASYAKLHQPHQKL